MNSVELSGIVCSVPTSQDFIVYADDEYIHCVCQQTPELNAHISLKGKLKSHRKVYQGKNIVMHYVEIAGA